MILQIENIETFYGLGHILHGLSLNVAEGEVAQYAGEQRRIVELQGRAAAGERHGAIARAAELEHGLVERAASRARRAITVARRPRGPES